MKDVAIRCYCPGEHCNGAVCHGRPRSTATLGGDGTDLCLDGGSRHAWHNTGLDVALLPSGEYADFYTAKCVWCAKEGRRAYDRGPIRDGVRKRP